MFRFVLLLLALLFSLNSFSQMTDVEKASLPYQNYAVNPGGESGKIGWSEVGSGTLSVDTAVKHDGKASIKFVSSGTPGDYFQTALVSCKQGPNCLARFYYKTSATTFTLAIYNNSAVKQNEIQLGSTTDFEPKEITFIVPSGTHQVRWTDSGTNNTINVDSLYIGRNDKVGETAQAALWAARKWQVTGGCEWGAITNSSYTDFSTNSTCDDSAITYLGEAIAESSNPGQLPQIYLKNLPEGEYYIFSNASLRAVTGTSQSASCLWRLYDGTTEIGTAKSAYYDDQSNSVFRDIYAGSLVGHLSNSTARNNVTIKIQAKADVNNSCYIENAASIHQPLTFYVYRFPSKSQTIVSAENANYYGAAEWGIGGETNRITSGSFGSFFTLGGLDGSRVLYGKATAHATSNAFALKMPSLPPGEWEVTFNGPMKSKYNSSYSWCQFGISDGTTAKGSGVSYESPNEDGVYISSTSAIFKYDSMADRSFYLTARNYSSTGECYIYAILTTQATMTIRPTNQSVSMPQIINSFITNYKGQVSRNFATIAAGNDSTACTSGTCTEYRESGDWISSSSFVSTGRYYVDFVSGIFSDKPVCQITSVGTNYIPGFNIACTTSRCDIYFLTHDNNLANTVFNISCDGFK